MRILLACTLCVLNVAISYGRAMLGNHNKACQPVSGLVTVAFPNCRTSDVKVNQCIGTCLSWDGFYANNAVPGHMCECCKPATFLTKKIYVECVGADGKEHVQERTIHHPKACHCTPCHRRRKRSDNTKPFSSMF